MGFCSRLNPACLALFLLMLGATGCGNFAARRIAQAPNSYPRWLAPDPPVTIAFSSKVLAAFTNQQIQITSPPARITYRIIEPADYHFRWTNRLDEARGLLNLQFTADVPPSNTRGDPDIPKPRGTVFIIHGYGVDGAAMFPWAFILAERGWRCVLVDLRGHGRSISKRIYFGPQEVKDLSTLLDHLQSSGHIDGPISLLGHSFGAVVALRWKSVDPRIDRVIAMSPYSDLARAVLNVRRQYARWVPPCFLKAGLKKLPDLLEVPACDLTPSCWIDQNLSEVLFVAGGADKISTIDQVQSLLKASSPQNRIKVIENAAHETLPFYLDELASPVTEWLSRSPTE